MEATKIKMNMDGTIRAKVLQYKSDGNTLIEKWETLKKYTEGVYYNLTPDNYGGEYCNIVLEIKGVFWKNNITPGNVFCIGHYAHKRWDNEARTVVATFPDIVRKNSKLGKYINELQIEVMRRLGHDVADLQASNDEYIRQREERNRQRAEEAERREAEERRKAEVLADGKKRLLKHERISEEQIELIAEALGYKINIRTIGFMREKVTGAIVSDNGVRVLGYKLTSRNIDGTKKVMHELYDCIKAQAEEEAEQPAQPAETPQISTETAEMVNVSAEGEKEAERPQYRVWRFAKPNYAQIIVSDYSQWKVVAVLSFVWGKTQIEVSDDVANIHTIGKKELTIDKPLTELTDAEVLELIYNHTEPPQSSETPQTVDCATDTPKPRETARKPQNLGIGNTRHSRLGANGYAMLDNASATLTAMHVPREYSTADAAYW